jgi:hypothetical protein
MGIADDVERIVQKAVDLLDGEREVTIPAHKNDHGKQCNGAGKYQDNGKDKRKCSCGKFLKVKR